MSTKMRLEVSGDDEDVAYLGALGRLPDLLQPPRKPAP